MASKLKMELNKRERGGKETLSRTKRNNRRNNAKKADKE